MKVGFPYRLELSLGVPLISGQRIESMYHKDATPSELYIGGAPQRLSKQDLYIYKEVSYESPNNEHSQC